jgi:hypothetical protein
MKTKLQILLFLCLTILSFEIKIKSSLTENTIIDEDPASTENTNKNPITPEDLESKLQIYKDQIANLEKVKLILNSHLFLGKC